MQMTQLRRLVSPAFSPLEPDLVCLLSRLAWTKVFQSSSAVPPSLALGEMSEEYRRRVSGELEVFVIWAKRTGAVEVEPSAVCERSV